MTPEEIDAALALYRSQTPLSNPEGTWAAPNTAPMGAAPGTVDTTAMSPEASTVGEPDWMAVARQYGSQQPAPDQETGLDPALAEVPTVTAPQSPREALDVYARATADQAKAVRARGEQTAQAYEAESMLAESQIGELDERDRQYAEQRATIDARTNELFSKVEKLNAEADNMRVYDRRSTEQTITGAVALALASIGQGFDRMGGITNSNPIAMVQNQITQQIERDLQLQREAISDKRKSAAAAMSELGMARTLGLDAKDTEEFARALMLQKHGRAATALGKSTQAAEARAVSEQSGTALEAASAEKMSEIIDRNARTQAYADMARAQARNTRGGSGSGGQPSSFETIQAKIAAGGQGLTAGEMKVANSKAYTDWQKNTTKGEQEIIPGFTQDANAVPLTQGEINDVRKQYRSARGVQFLTDELAKLWQTAVDPKSSDEARTEARTKYAGYMNDLQAGKSVQTGQGTVTEGDAKRLAASGAYPELPTNWLGAARPIENWVKDKDPGAASIREIGNAAIGKIEAELMDTYGIRRRQGSPAPKAASEPKAAPSRQVITRDDLSELD